jgi:predicted lipid-binding transport protein (Tim44 family)
MTPIWSITMGIGSNARFPQTWRGAYDRGMRRARAVSMAVVSLALLWAADPAQGAAGGGSSGFGGGGGGGGSFGGGGGSGYSGSGGGSLVGALVVFGFFALLFLFAGIAALRFARKRRKRIERVRLASAEAAQDDPAFAADAVIPAATRLFRQAQEAWDARDRQRLRTLVGEDLFAEWSLRLDDFDAKAWHNRVLLRADPEVQYVGLVNRAADREDRVVVHVKAQLEDYVVDSHGQTINRTGASSTTTGLAEFWTLAKRDGRWVVVSIEQSAEGAHQWESEIVASPWSDSRVADEAVVETAVADRLPPGFKPADLADLDFDGDARAAALDLSVADPRFAPAVLEAAARRAVEAWAVAVDGDDAPLESVASPEAVGALLYPGDPSRRTRLVVRGPRVRAIRIAALDAAAEPATMTIDVELGGVRYVENRDTAAVVAGDRNRATSFGERWTLALAGLDERPWRIVQIASAAAPA